MAYRKKKRYARKPAYRSRRTYKKRSYARSSSFGRTRGVSGKKRRTAVKAVWNEHISEWVAIRSSDYKKLKRAVVFLIQHECKGKPLERDAYKKRKKYFMGQLLKHKYLKDSMSEAKKKYLAELKKYMDQEGGQPAQQHNLNNHGHAGGVGGFMHDPLHFLEQQGNEVMHNVIPGVANAAGLPGVGGADGSGSFSFGSLLSDISAIAPVAEAAPLAIL